MENTPKKSKAVWITIIAILVLLIAGYFIFKNSDSLFGTKSSTNITKNFSPLLGTSKDTTGQGTVTTVTTTTTTGGSQGDGSTDTTTNGQGTFGGSQGIGNNGGLNGGNGLGGGSLGTTGSINGSNGVSVIPPAFNPIPTPDTQDSGYSGIDINPDNSPTTDPVVNSTPVQSSSICPDDDPLVFTDAENVQLADLLRQYYLVANTIKTDDDIAVAENDFLQNKALVDQVHELTAECRSEKANIAYTGPQTIKNNPYYSDPFNTTTTYVTPANLTSPWIRTSEYYQSGYGTPSISFSGGGLVQWPNAYYGIKLKSYKDFEDKFNIW